MLNGQPVHSLKGIGEKTGKLFEKLGVLSIDDLLAYYPRAYDTYEAPVPIGQLKDQTVAAVESVLLKGADLVRLNHIQIVSVQLKDMTGSLQVSWYNMPYMRANLKSGETYVFRGRVVKKRGRLVMEQPEVFTPQAYEAVAHSMQPVYGQTRGLSNKTIVKAQQQALEAVSYTHLLVILGILLLIILAVLFAPVRYKAEFSWHGEPDLALKASWFLHLLSFRALYTKEGLKFVVRVLGFSLLGKHDKDALKDAADAVKDGTEDVLDQEGQTLYHELEEDVRSAHRRL